MDAKRNQYQILMGLSLIIALMSFVLNLWGSQGFQRFFGNNNPLIVVSIVIILSFVLLSWFISQGWFAIYRKKNLKDLLLPFSLVIPISVGIILVDSIVVFPESLNILFPESLLFYPTIGFVAEVIFHLLPLALLLAIFISFFKVANHNKIIWVSIFIVSIIESVFQIVGFIGVYVWWSIAYVLLHVFVINVIQLWLFKRYDFITMYAFRIVFYLIWHIAWGYIRLQVLF